MSGEYAALLRRRALSMLRLARELAARGDADLAALNADYAAQLYLKSVLYRVSGEEWRGHGLRALMGALVVLLRQAGFSDEAQAVEDYVRANRRILAELEEAHTRAVYGALEYSIEQAEKLVEAAERLVELLQSIEKRVFGGEA